MLVGSKKNNNNMASCRCLVTFGSLMSCILPIESCSCLLLQMLSSLGLVLQVWSAMLESLFYQLLLIHLSAAVCALLTLSGWWDGIVKQETNLHGVAYYCRPTP